MPNGDLRSELTREREGWGAAPLNASRPSDLRSAKARRPKRKSTVRILLVSNNLPPVTGGSVTVYENLCQLAQGAIVALAPSHDYTTGRAFEAAQAYDAGAPYPIHRTKFLRPPNAPQGGGSRLADLVLMARILSKVVSVARKERTKVICLGDLVYSGWLIFPLRYLLGYKVVLYIHGEEITTQSGGGMFDAWRARFLAHADAIVAVSTFTVEAMIRLMGADPAKIVLIPNGVDLKRFHVRTPAADAPARYGVAGRRVVLSVGRLVPRKGMDRLVEAMAIVRREVPDAHLLIAGEGPLAADLRRLIAENGLEGAVTLLGPVSDEALNELYALADVFALPNREMPDGDTEGFGLVFLEANASGKPVVAGRAGGAVDAVSDEVNGLTVDGADVGAIATAVLRLLQDPALHARLSRGGLEVAARSDWRTRADQFRALCESLARRPA